MTSERATDDARADLALAAIIELVEKYQRWLVADHAVPPGATPEQSAECLAAAHLLTLVARRRGMRAAVALSNFVVDVMSNWAEDPQ